MNFTNLVDIIKVFANEYCIPASIVLLVGRCSCVKSIFTFLNSEVVIIDTVGEDHLDLIVNTTELFPFESKIFDLIIILNTNYSLNEINRVLKSNGKILINERIVDSLELYTLNDSFFSVN
jgi:SAM-dependent methyltransferase